jgi:3-oxoacyl-[acyl-carrier protein] reductase
MRLKDSVIVITGAGRGLGRAMAELMAAEGGKIVVCDREPALVEATVAAIRNADGKAIGQIMDVTTRPEIAAMVQATVAEWGRIDVLINNAGITRDATLAKMTEEQFDQVIDVNLKGVMNCAQAVLPTMLVQGRGKLINIASIVGVFGNFGQTNYAAAKAGVIAMTKTWARELGRKGITANAVAPGFINTEMVAAMPENVLAGMVARVPMARLGAPDDVARACLFLASADADYINGHTLAVDGGLTL